MLSLRGLQQVQSSIEAYLCHRWKLRAFADIAGIRIPRPALCFWSEMRDTKLPNSSRVFDFEDLIEAKVLNE